MTTTHSRIVDRTDFEPCRIRTDDLFLEIFHVVERVVSDVGAFSESECEFSMSEETGGYCGLAWQLSKGPDDDDDDDDHPTHHAPDSTTSRTACMGIADGKRQA